MKRRVPRKIKKQIPTGPYCYTATSGFGKMKDGQWGYTIKLCPMFSYRKRIDILEHLDRWDKEYIKENPEESREFAEDLAGYCKFIKCEIADQCKSCSLKWNDYE
jgi:hypothetical protein